MAHPTVGGARRGLEKTQTVKKVWHAGNKNTKQNRIHNDHGRPPGEHIMMMGPDRERLSD